MYINVNLNQFCDSFSDSYKNNFSYEGKGALFDYIENLEEETGEKIELDTVALCCDYTEYESLTEYQENYVGTEAKTIDEVEEDTTVIRIGNTDRFIIANY